MSINISSNYSTSYYSSNSNSIASNTTNTFVN
ncbi:hypothetical protein CPAST_c32540 [Clostridium pasteurianum DSM 525 = ATCC 6013]|uniref:Uncharacterized protein n=1 Tax=Clostridium pasteurianum DSM 525 = ATCC 6013 TaxID=1262449 RepID=A0A0H3JB91_CLOPA|nr:hypothetical protein CPAST_c32540 [Clostridium pasteurianum DSM 525 = ATCC 6013]AJA53308.1 hypothetical protein CLPA_c32540 [Clostridium pasteurianum DSM 525 = ATCC 6013]